MYMQLPLQAVQPGHAAFKSQNVMHVLDTISCSKSPWRKAASWSLDSGQGCWSGPSQQQQGPQHRSGLPPEGTGSTPACWSAPHASPGSWPAVNTSSGANVPLSDFQGGSGLAIELPRATAEALLRLAQYTCRLWSSETSRREEAPTQSALPVC